MSVSYEDATPQDITGDPAPTRPLTRKQMAGAQSATVNRTRIGPKGPVGASGLKAGGNGQAKQEADAEKQDPGQEAKPDIGPAGAQPAHGIQPAWDALSGGIGEILKDPQWMQHPLLHVFHDLATDPGKD